MSKWISLSAPCLACLAFLTTGAMPPFVPLAVRSSASPVPRSHVHESFQPAQASSAHGLDPRQILDRTLAAQRDLRWLRVTIWQRLHAADRDEAYESEGRLVLGPDHCARLETTVRTGSASCQVLAVSDGRALAEVLRSPGSPEKVTGCYLPDKDAAVREHLLRKHGCVGPLPLLSELRTIVKEWQVEAGTWRDRPVLRLQGPVDLNRPKAAAPARSLVPSLC